MEEIKHLLIAPMPAARILKQGPIITVCHRAIARLIGESMPVFINYPDTITIGNTIYFGSVEELNMVSNVGMAMIMSGAPNCDEQVTAEVPPAQQ